MIVHQQPWGGQPISNGLIHLTNISVHNCHQESWLAKIALNCLIISFQGTWFTTVNAQMVDTTLRKFDLQSHIAIQLQTFVQLRCKWLVLFPDFLHYAPDEWGIVWRVLGWDLALGPHDHDSQLHCTCNYRISLVTTHHYWSCNFDHPLYKLCCTFKAIAGRYPVSHPGKGWKSVWAGARLMKHNCKNTAKCSCLY